VEQRSTILWRRLDLPGHEIATLAGDRSGWHLSGVALLAHEGRPCRLEYEIDCDATWETRTVSIRGAVGGVSTTLDLSRSAEHAWHENGLLVPQLQGCVDVDLGFSPSTNLLPIRRLDLAIGGRASVRAAWVRFPELTLEVLEQVYTRLSERTYLYESAGGAFRRELTVNHSGFVVDYPDFWRAEAEVII
jgi:hypothetical protein